MRKNKFLMAFTLLLAMCSSQVFGQIRNGDFNAGSTNANEVADEWLRGAGYTSNNNTSWSGAGIISWGNTSLYIDGRDAASGNNEIFRQDGIDLPTVASNLTFMARSRTTGFPATVHSNVIQIWLNNAFVQSVTINNSTMQNFTVALPLGSVNSGPNNTISFRQATFDGNGRNDWQIDDIDVPCSDYLVRPAFSVNGNSAASGIMVCDADDITLAIAHQATLGAVFLAIDDLTAGLTHARYLTAAERTSSSLANFDLVNFAYNPANTGLNTIVSNSLPLIEGHCYKVKVAFQNGCTNWAETIKTFCIESKCSVTASFEVDDLPYPCNPVGFLSSGSSSGSYFWDFGDGNTSSLANPIHQYANPGYYTVTLLAYENNECGTCCDVYSTEIYVDCGTFTGTAMTWTSDSEENPSQQSGDLTQSTELWSNEAADQFKVYPNPAENRITIRFETEISLGNSSLEIYNASGQLVAPLLKDGILESGVTNYSLDVSELPAGLYHVNLVSDGMTKSNSFVVK